MTETSARFALPLLQSGQAQKEIYHNEALALIDLAIAPRVEALAVNDPPMTPAVGQCWIVGPTPTGDWGGRAETIAGWTSGGWRFVAPAGGMLVWVSPSGMWARRASGAWLLGDLPVSRLSVGGQQVIGSRQAAISEPAGGSVIDVEARLAVAAILAALRSHGLIAT